MRRVVLEQRLGFVATVTPDGRPNLSPKGTTTVWDDRHLMFADIASPGTVENIASNPYVEVNVVDPIVRRGYRFKGTATVATSGEHSNEDSRCFGSGGRPHHVNACARSSSSRSARRLRWCRPPTTKVRRSRRWPPAGSTTTWDCTDRRSEVTILREYDHVTVYFRMPGPVPRGQTAPDGRGARSAGRYRGCPMCPRLRH